jgi:hypothetical protein
MGLYRPNEVLGGDLDFITAYTLIDITDSGYSNPKGNSLEYQQAQNLNTIIQILSMRTQLVISGVSILENQDLTKYEFGTDYSGNHTVWLLKFASEHPSVWAKKDDKLFFARTDCNNAPVHINLNETAATTNMFVTEDSSSLNLYYKINKSI